MVDVEAMVVDAPQSILEVEPSGIRISSTCTAPTPAIASRPPLIQALIYKMGNLAYSADVRAARVEAVVPNIIERVIGAALASIREEMIG